MQRLAEVIFAQGLWGIRLSYVEDLPMAIAPAYDKPTAAVNGFFSLCYTIAYFMPLFPTHQFQTCIVFFRFYHTGKSAVTDQRFQVSSKTNVEYLLSTFL